MKSLLSRITTVLILLVLAGIVCGTYNSTTAYADPAPLQQAANQAATSSASSDACDNTNSSASLKKCVQNNQIIRDLQTIVNVLSAGVGLVVIGMIILGGIQYSIAGDNPQATGAAKQRITNALLALLAFLFIFAFLQWLIPGGLFG